MRVPSREAARIGIGGPELAAGRFRDTTAATAARRGIASHARDGDDDDHPGTGHARDGHAAAAAVSAGAGAADGIEWRTG